MVCSAALWLAWLASAADAGAAERYGKIPGQHDGGSAVRHSQTLPAGLIPAGRNQENEVTINNAKDVLPPDRSAPGRLNHPVNRDLCNGRVRADRIIPDADAVARLNCPTNGVSQVTML